MASFSSSFPRTLVRRHSRACTAGLGAHLLDVLAVPTPNPAAMKFEAPAFSSFPKSVTFRPTSLDSSSPVPVVGSLLRTSPDIRELTVGPGFITVTLDDLGSWQEEDRIDDFVRSIGDALRRDMGDQAAAAGAAAIADDGDAPSWPDALRDAILRSSDQYDHYASRAEGGDDAGNDDTHKGNGAGDGSTLRARVAAVIDAEVRPHVLSDGGDVELHRVDEAEGLVSLRLVGACASCPSSTVTIKFMITNLLRYRFPDEVREVVKYEEEEEDSNDDGEGAGWTG